MIARIASEACVRHCTLQIGWSEYWSSLTTALVSETAPDVFTNHVTRYPEFVVNNVLLDLAPYIALLAKLNQRVTDLLGATAEASEPRLAAPE